MLKCGLTHVLNFLFVSETIFTQMYKYLFWKERKSTFLLLLLLNFEKSKECNVWKLVTIRKFPLFGLNKKHMRSSDCKIAVIVKNRRPIRKEWYVLKLLLSLKDKSLVSPSVNRAVIILTRFLGC